MVAKVIADLSSADVEDGRAHPFMRELLAELAMKHAATARAIEAQPISDSARAWHAGHASAVREVVNLIKAAKGRADEQE